MASILTHNYWDLDHIETAGPQATTLAAASKEDWSPEDWSPEDWSPEDWSPEDWYEGFEYN